MEIDRVGSPGSVLRAERRATPLVRGGASNHGSWRKNVVNSYTIWEAVYLMDVTERHGNKARQKRGHILWEKHEMTVSHFVALQDFLPNDSQWNWRGRLFHSTCQPLFLVV